MSILSDAKAIVGLQRIKSGGHANLSISQVTCLIVNMLDARKNLPAHEYGAVYACYKNMRSCKSKTRMDFAGYIEAAVRIILEFDKYAPYEKYSGNNEFETLLMMENIRGMDAASAAEYAVKKYIMEMLDVDIPNEKY